MDGNAAADAATVSGADAAAAAAPVHEWKDIYAYCKNHPQERGKNHPLYFLLCTLRCAQAVL